MVFFTNFTACGLVRELPHAPKLCKPPPINRFATTITVISSHRSSVSIRTDSALDRLANFLPKHVYVGNLSNLLITKRAFLFHPNPFKDTRFTILVIATAYRRILFDSDLI